MEANNTTWRIVTTSRHRIIFEREPTGGDLDNPGSSWERQQLGKFAETQAKTAVALIGGQVLSSNQRIGRLELDLLYSRLGKTRILETRARSASHFDAARMLPQTKRQNLKALAQQLSLRMKRRIHVDALFFLFTTDKQKMLLYFDVLDDGFAEPDRWKRF